jgi:hypothetical protein
MKKLSVGERVRRKDALDKRFTGQIVEYRGGIEKPVLVRWNMGNPTIPPTKRYSEDELERIS